MGALARTAGGCHQVAVAVLADDTGMKKHRLLFGRREGVGHHECIVEGKVAVRPFLAQQLCGTLAEKTVGGKYAAELAGRVAHLYLIAPIGHAINTVVVT